jgi:hypothetical protein
MKGNRCRISVLYALPTPGRRWKLGDAGRHYLVLSIEYHSNWMG